MQKFNLAVKHQSGKGKQAEVLEAYSAMPNCEVLTFIDDMEAAFAWADIIICRSGALTVAEVAGAGRAAIFVPLPIAVDDHQTANAKSLSDNQAAILLPQSNIEDQLEAHLSTLCSDPQKRIEMAKRAHKLAPKNATQNVVNFIQKASAFAPKNQDSQ
jgi:UDP-N-acetylglucosamine--N-acetylmuramyl-(pentapeptide) pyrophosphoryl-undecaprenol N-acetylglucosamine transferase